MEDISQSLIIEPLQGDVSEEVNLFRLRVFLSGEWSAKIIAVKGDKIAILDEETKQIKEEHVAKNTINNIAQLKEEIIWNGLWKID
ncbi:hypothetical protein [Pontibacillus sp. HMF3514]|uniref:hypothetical protein n=1 Tax=Pontibacillus sp. HMF3514 TaxID=2692425 RepID=UPI00131F752C|nr:hypothetical protein [Pontibacillus sp. HMF3514]QHE51689.1 hypothetical protein GS400_06400 [Pontibacillus sp. HMF3514]